MISPISEGKLGTKSHFRQIRPLMAPAIDQLRVLAGHCGNHWKPPHECFYLSLEKACHFDPDGSIILTCPHESTGLTCPTPEQGIQVRSKGVEFVAIFRDGFIILHISFLPSIQFLHHQARQKTNWLDKMKQDV